MGNVQGPGRQTSLDWANKDAVDCLRFLTALFGKPTISAHGNGGIAVWNRLKDKTLFGKPICFEKIMIKDEAVPDRAGQKGFLYLFLQVPVDQEKVCQLSGAIPGFGYDRTQKLLILRSSCLDAGIISVKFITDFLVGKTTLEKSVIENNLNLQSTMDKSATMDRAAVAKAVYTGLCENLTRLQSSISENMTDAPWYAGSDPYYVSAQPAKIALGETENEMYYRRNYEFPYMFPGSSSYPETTLPMSDFTSILDPETDQTTEHLSSKYSFATVVPQTGNLAKSQEEEDMLLPPPSADCRGACVDRYYYSLSKPRERFNEKAVYGLFKPDSGKATLAEIIGQREHMTRPRAYSMPPRQKKEHMVSDSTIYGLFKPDAGRPTLADTLGSLKRERMTTSQLFQPDLGRPTLDDILGKSESKKVRREFLDPNAPLSINQAYKLFIPRYENMKGDPLFSMGSHLGALEAMTVDQAYQLFRPKRRAGIEQMSSRERRSPISIAKALSLFEPRGSIGIEHLADKQIRQLFHPRGLLA